MLTTAIFKLRFIYSVLLLFPVIDIAPNLRVALNLLLWVSFHLLSPVKECL